MIDLLVLGVGCYRTYSGSYFLEKADEVKASRLQDLDVQVDVVVNTFGFSRMTAYLPGGLVAWSRAPARTGPELLFLAGSGARIAIAVDVTSRVITIRDLDNDTETEFVRELERQLEIHLEKYYGIREIRFERTSDLLSRNRHGFPHSLVERPD